MTKKIKKYVRPLMTKKIKKYVRPKVPRLPRPKVGFIYSLVDNITGKIFYIGQTISPENRIMAHKQTFRDRYFSLNIIERNINVGYYLDMKEYEWIIRLGLENLENKIANRPAEYRKDWNPNRKYTFKNNNKR